MKKKDIDKLMKIAVKEAISAAKSGAPNRPFGAVLADKNGKLIIKAGNTTKTDKDITAHAEMNLLKKAFKKLKTVDLSPYILVSSAEPCSMCASAAIKAGIKAFYYGKPTIKDFPRLRLAEVAKRARGKIFIKGGLT